MGNILIADDEKDIREGLCQIIRDHIDFVGTIFQAEDGVEALKILSQNEVEILVSDIKMPVIDGVELLHRLAKAKYPCQVIMLSGYDDYHYLRNALRFGALDYLLKPVNIETFVELLNNAHKLQKKMRQEGKIPEKIPIVFKEEKNFGDDGNIFFDEPGKETDRQKEEEHLKKAADEIYRRCYEEALNELSIFFNGVASTYSDAAEVRNVLHKWTFGLMERNHRIIQVISNHRLTDYDVIGIIKNMPTLSQLRIRFLGCFKRYFSILTQDESQEEKRLLRHAREIIEKNCLNGITLNDVANELHLSPNYFSTLFKNETGITFREYALNCRMERAKEMLLNWEKSIAEIGFLLGYEDISHFNRAFKNTIGCTPSQFRRRGKI